jgi:ankyrin repeat protein
MFKTFLNWESTHTKNIHFINKKFTKSQKDNYQIESLTLSEKIYKYCEQGNLTLIKQVINNFAGKEIIDWDRGLRGACIGGPVNETRRVSLTHKDIIKLMISLGANDWDSGLYGACKGGHKDIIKLMILLGANDWNFGLYYACLNGYKDIIKLMISLGANEWNWGLQSACRGGHKDIIKLLILLGANNWYLGLYHACEGGHKDIIKLMISLGATECKYYHKSRTLG